MKWEKYTIDTTTAAEDLIVSALYDLGIAGAEIENNVPLTAAETAKMFIDIPPELGADDGTSRVSFYLEAGEDHGQLLAGVRAALEELRAFVDVGAGTFTQSETEDADWANNWKEFFHPFTIAAEPGGRDLLIKPTWEELPEADEGKLVIEIDPGISFGTGQHETTQLCIRQLMKHLRPGDRVLDVGCGSGILSVVSRKLGAGYVVGTDIDPDCLTSTRENFAANHLDGADAFYLGNLIDDAALRETVGGNYDIVVANILAEVIVPLAPVIPARLTAGGLFIASGILDTKESVVRNALEDAGLSVCEVTRQGEWIGITAKKEW